VRVVRPVFDEELIESVFGIWSLRHVEAQPAEPGCPDRHQQGLNRLSPIVQVLKTTSNQLAAR